MVDQADMSALIRRKRKRADADDSRNIGEAPPSRTKQPRREASSEQHPAAHRQLDPVVKHALLTRCFPQVLTLRAYLLSRLPASSRIRRKKLREVGLAADPSPVEQRLRRLLDNALVACSHHDGSGQGDKPLDSLPSLQDDRQQQRLAYIEHKRAEESHVIISNAQEGVFSPQSEPLCNLEPLTKFQATEQTARDTRDEKSLSDISFVRNRMFYAKPSMAQSGAVHFGLKHIHVLNRFSYRSCPTKKVGLQELAAANNHGTVHMMMYMFPRQFGLHNVFTSVVDRATTAQRFQDYTLREAEISAKFGKIGWKDRSASVRIPKRLRGMAVHLVERLRKLHNRCSYYELLQHYCPDIAYQETRHEVTSAEPGSHKEEAHTLVSLGHPNQESASKDVATTGQDPAPQRQQCVPYSSKSGPELKSTTPLVELATPLQRVSTFCQAVILNVVPNDFWGNGEAQAKNRQAVLKKVDLFLRLRRFETLNLHDLMQGIKISDILWLAPPGLRKGKISQTDVQKRRQIFAEFLYYLFDSFLIPLVRSNFYVTESSSHRNKLFFFRHDVWRRITEPALVGLKARMFEDIKHGEALQILGSRDLGYGQIRLLPKQATVRPIMNLRRRTAVKGGTRLGSSANTILAPVQAMLKFEILMFSLLKKQHPERLGSGMFSVGTLFKKLKEFKKRMASESQHTFYLAKVDVKSAFDTMPQEAVVELVHKLSSHRAYYMDKHVEMAAPENRGLGGVFNAAVKGDFVPMRRWKTIASASTDASGFHDVVESSLATYQRNAIFADTAYRKPRDSASLVGLAASHILQNLVKIGKKFYRQKTGIPQGSVLSALLCNCFYAELEAEELGFLDADGSKGCLLLRLIDDFLLITTDQSKAARFVEVMHRGLPQYGVAVSSDKSLVNFDLQGPDGKSVSRVANGAWFPYCGLVVNCLTLDIAKDWETKKQEHARSPGHNFKRKIFNGFKVLSHVMFFDTAHNSLRTTLCNAHKVFSDTAVKVWAYTRCLPRDKRPSTRLVISTIEELSELAYTVLNGRARRMPEYQFSVFKPQLRWLLLHAFSGVLGKKQAGYSDVLTWIRSEMHYLRSQQDLRLPKIFIETSVQA
ncbi:telomerase reverse [Grosmannia clavigera kw1407]|uniref:Telomerase reverse transcriptase n=1 Tax=Grosmannia clavigera (strain kw1407 / UAMH 11150) TaxID=655863 RepID=F0XKQ7_GROCL|nr:telomerase reverse [Grosmannia clavigera kw1407]EFX01630.1 telomerase reverse [Grosmannia clavigera kw1407]